MLLGIAVCLILAVLATWLGGLQHLIGAPMIGMFLGILLANALPAAFRGKTGAGTGFSAKRLLRVGIILAGGTLNFNTIIRTGASALPIVLLAMAVAFTAAALAGKLLRVSPKTRVMVGGGTSICGGTAIATISAIIEAKEDETAYAMTSIFLFDILAALIWPYIAAALSFTPAQFSILGGVAINDVSSVSAAGNTFNSLMGSAAFNSAGVSGGDLAMIIKLTRVALLVVVAVIITLVYQAKRRRESAGEKTSAVKSIVGAFPFYVLGFLLLAVANTLFDFSGMSVCGLKLSYLLSRSYKYFITAALVGVGCKIKLRELFTKGLRPLLLGGCTWAAVAVIAFVWAAVVM